MNKSQEIFFNHLAQTNETPYLIDVESAEGIYITDKKGKSYIDMIAGVAVNNIGHRNPMVLEAIQNQMNKYLHVMVYGEYIQDIQLNFAKSLNFFLPKSLHCHYPVNSGTEANEAALKLAKRYTGRSKLFSFKNSYHGSTHGSLSVTGNEKKKHHIRPLLPNIFFIEYNSINEISKIDNETAAVIIEPIQGDAGVRIPSHNFIRKLRDRCTETGTLLIFDEVQTGIGRTGKMFAYEHFDVVPDILVLGKALGGGMSIGCFSSSKEIMSSFKNNPMLGHITTFGGHPINLSASDATLRFIKNSNLIDGIEEKGVFLEAFLSQSNKIKEIRRVGLMFAIDMDSFEVVYKVVQNCLDRGLISFWFLSCPTSFRLSPPLTITMKELEIAGNIILESIDSV